MTGNKQIGAVPDAVGMKDSPLREKSILFPDARPAPLRTDCNELLKMLSATCKTVEARLSAHSGN